MFEHVPYRTYRIAEIKSPTGYSLNRNTSYKVTIEEDGSLVSARIKEEELTAVSTEPANPGQGVPPKVAIRNANGHKVYDGAGSGVNIGGWHSIILPSS